MNWRKFMADPSYLSLNVSLKLIRHWADFHGFLLSEFVYDAWDILATKLPKTNMMFLEGVPNSGKSFVLRSVVALYKYSATVQGTS